MDKREGETSGLRSLSVSDSIDRRELFGGLDRNLEIIEKNLKVDIIQRGNELLLKGENSQKAENLLKEMMGVLEKGGKLDQQKINYIADLSNEGISYKQENVEKGIICFTHDGKPLRPKTLGQKIYVESIRNHDIVFGIGPAGTGKTYIAVAMAVNALKNKEVQKIILARPAVEAGERLGFLPGDLSQKVDPYLRPLYDALNDMLGAESVQKYLERGVIEIAPLAYMRGRTLNRASIIIDESQNASLSTLKMALTRLGEDSKMVLTGDITQIDLPKKEDSGLEKCASILSSIEGIAIVRLNNRDVVRNRLVKDIVKAFEKAESEKKTAAFNRQQTRGKRK